ncbi:uncharacterized protein RSE6_09477 [Rhynchosporium secalis]|uniref:Uncharacterized protein n=1 Tax=Rhynchosporium secalis TaxID=38038 RepID=A0A1E1MHY8_RHYSE|nr:uncharacterized protein RSE6_09477 [Rhynchosporium secalis]
MRSSSILLIAALTFVIAPTPQYPTASTINGTIGLGEQCSSSAECANGANCYSTNSGLITQCGNFQATCSSNTQCAFNTCENGFCNGFIPSTTTGSSTYPSGKPDIVYLPLGADCNPNSTPCANGSTCYAVNFMLQPRCGNFQAHCSKDSQCAFNTCQNGLCNGFIASTTSAASRHPVTSTSSSSQPTSTSASVDHPLGSNCDPKVDTCSGGAQCYATNYMLQPRCGNFQAACTTDAQCAVNKSQQLQWSRRLLSVVILPLSDAASSAASTTVSVIESSPQPTYVISTKVAVQPQTITTTSSKFELPQQSTGVVVTTPVVTESSVAVVTESATRNPASIPTTSNPAQIISNDASASKVSPLVLVIFGVLAMIAFV